MMMNQAFSQNMVIMYFGTGCKRLALVEVSKCTLLSLRNCASFATGHLYSSSTSIIACKNTTDVII